MDSTSEKRLCIYCGKDIAGMVRIEGPDGAKCLKHGLGVSESGYQAKPRVRPSKQTLQQQGRDAYHGGKGYADCPYNVTCNPMAFDVTNWLTGWWSEYYKANPSPQEV